MALDRQKILTELGSVMNQLKSVDCGCMGKIFGNSEQNSVPAEQHVHSCFGHQQSCCDGNIPNWRWNQSLQRNRCCSAPQNIRQPYTVPCNLPKLYSDTYSYLNQNLMQPTMKEVYDDLKGLTPENTVINNPLAGQMGLMAECKGQGHSGGLNTSNKLQKITFNEADKSNIPYINQASKVGGMGPQIMNMLGENNINHKPQQNKHLGNTLINNVPQSSYSTTGESIISNSLGFGGLHHEGDGIVPNQCLHQSDLKGNANQHNLWGKKQHMPLNTSCNPYGQYTDGITKFKEMFPDAMKKDLGYDPMAIAIQMNPANRKQTADDSHKMLYNKQSGIMNDEAKYCTPNQVITQNNPISMQCLMEKNEVNKQLAQRNQQVYPKFSNSTVLDQQHVQYHQPNIINSNLSNGVCPQNLPTLYEESVPTSAQPVAQNYANKQHMIKEPIYPADTSKYGISTQKYPEYNTLGQPIETLPASIYHTPLPSLPQTLSPQPAANHKIYNSTYSNVKSTVSKTSLLARKPTIKAPSRNRLQHIYNQYKGSQSYTQQSLKDQTGKEAHINAFNKRLLPIEKIGGDSAANNCIQHLRNKTEQLVGQIGDAPNINKPYEEEPLQKISPTSRKCRNGLQDVVFTSYPTSAAWSFHGNNKTLASAGYRYHKKM